MKTEICNRLRVWIFARCGCSLSHKHPCAFFASTNGRLENRGEQQVENTPTWFICFGRYCYTAMMVSFWEVPSGYRIFLPMQKTEFIKHGN